MRAIMDAYNDDTVRRITMKFSSQMAKTEGLLNMAFYAMDKHPGPMLIVQPTGNMAKTFVKDRMDPSIRDTKCLRDKIRSATKDELRGTGKKETLLHKSFPGGHATIIGGNSAAEMASRPIRDLFVDEIDRIPTTVGKKGREEGDPFALIEKRQNTFWNAKTVISSTPTVKGVSRIEMLYELSSMERYFVPCPHCGAMQVLHQSCLHWPKGRPDLAWYACAHCEERIEDMHKQAMLEAGEWVAEHPERMDNRGFHINELYSPWRGFTDIAKAWVEAVHGGVETLRVFINTVFGEEWDTNNEGERINPVGIQARQEPYGPEIPMDVAVITAAVDVQDDRLELMFMGHGLDNEKWVIPTLNSDGKLVSPTVVWGPPNKLSTWKALDPHLFQVFKHESGKRMRMSIALVDAGSGGHAPFVYKYTKARQGNRVFACSGSSTPSAPLSCKPTDNNDQRAKLFKLGVNNAKDILEHSLKDVTEPGPSYLHFPDGLPEEFYRQLTGEKVTIKHKQGVLYRIWEPIRERVEVRDVVVYNICAFSILDVKNIQAVLDELRTGMVKRTGSGLRKVSEVS